MLMVSGLLFPWSFWEILRRNGWGLVWQGRQGRDWISTAHSKTSARAACLCFNHFVKAVLGWHGMERREQKNPAQVGDVESRRVGTAGFFALLDKLHDGPVTNVETKDLHTSADDGHQILLRWFTKANTPAPGSAVVYAHGGGMITLQIEHYDQPIKRYVAATGVPVLAVQYRRAPEVQAPIPVTDTFAGLQYLATHAAELGVDPARIAIMGDSAGGGIAASLTHHIKAHGGPALKMQILIYPMLDDRSIVPDPNLDPFLTWTTDDNKTGWSALLGDRFGASDVPPTHAPGRMTVADAEGLPPAYIDVGELDLFRDEDLEYARKLGQAGVSCELHLIPSMPHAFDGLAPSSETVRAVLARRAAVIMSLDDTRCRAGTYPIRLYILEQSESRSPATSLMKSSRLDFTSSASTHLHWKAVLELIAL
nr:carboxylesterase nlhh [Quercus suber]